MPFVRTASLGVGLTFRGKGSRFSSYAGPDILFPDIKVHLLHPMVHRSKSLISVFEHEVHTPHRSAYDDAFRGAEYAHNRQDSANNFYIISVHPASLNVKRGRTIYFRMVEDLRFG